MCCALLCQTKRLYSSPYYITVNNNELFLQNNMNIKDSNMLTDKMIKGVSIQVKINHNADNQKKKKRSLIFFS